MERKRKPEWRDVQLKCVGDIARCFIYTEPRPIQAATVRERLLFISKRYVG
jgi:hypothetical protein